MLDVLRADGAKVVAFDVTFDYPDQTAAPVRGSGRGRSQEARRRIDPKSKPGIANWRSEYDADTQFGAAIKRFGNVVLGNFFLEKEESNGIDEAKLDAYADEVDWYRCHKNSPEFCNWQADFADSSTSYDAKAFVTQRQWRIFRRCRIRIIPAKPRWDFSMFRRTQTACCGVPCVTLPFGRSSDKLNEWRMFASLEVQAVRLYLGLPASQLTVNYGSFGVVSLDLGDKLHFRPDSTGHMRINYHGPRGAYPYYSIVDVVAEDSAWRVQGQARLGGSFGYRYRRLANAALRRHHLSGSGSSRQLHRQHAESRCADARRIAGIVGYRGHPVFWRRGGMWMALVAPRWMWFGLSFLVPLLAWTTWRFCAGGG